MAIYATNESTFKLIDPGNYLARCYQMIEIGTLLESFGNESNWMKKCRIGWELPEERNEEGKVATVSMEYTLSMNRKANLRKMLESWRGKAFTDDEAKKFDITTVIGAPCMLNVIHKDSKSGQPYAVVAGVTPIPKSMKVPPAVKDIQILSYDKFDDELFAKLPDFIKNKVKESKEYQAMLNPQDHRADDEEEENTPTPADDLPF